MMSSEAIKEKLRDPAYLDLHLVAAASVARIGATQWYDAHFLRRFAAAQYYLEQVRPDIVETFVAGFSPLRPELSFEIEMVEEFFDKATHDRIKEIARSIPDATLERHEVEAFGRHVVHDHPYFIELQRDLLPRVSAMVGQELVSGYNFLSLYGGEGKCDPHMDEPLSMYTLDYCIEQSCEWPIHFSQTVDWPTLETMVDWTPANLLTDPDIRFEAHVLKPNSALVFNGSSQWHYRDAIDPGGFCNLLFFHYFPKGAEALVRPSKWREHFDIPELGPLCDIFASEGIGEQHQ